MPNGSIFIDTPGMRELGLTAVDHGMTLTFGEISTLAQSCKFKDCQHLNESNCAVKEAVENGTIERDLYDNYLKLLKENDHYQTSVIAQKRKDKILAKRIRSMKKGKSC